MTNDAGSVGEGRDRGRRLARGLSGWLVTLTVGASLGAACSSGTTKLVEPAEGGAGGQNAVPGGGVAGPSERASEMTAGEGGLAVIQGGAGVTPVEGGAPGHAAAGAPADAGAPSDAGASASAGAGGADSPCGGCCSADDCPGDGAGYLCTDNECVNVAGSLSGLLWKLPCTAAHLDVSCASDATVTVATTLGGVSGVTYDVTLRFRGVVEPKNYNGGCADGAYWQSDGADNGDIGNVYELQVSAPPQHFFLNLAPTGANYTFALDYERTIRIDAGATVTLFAASIDSAELFNHDASGPISIPGTSVEQPFDGQFIQMDVEAITPDAIASGSTVGAGSSGSALSFSGAQLATVPEDAKLHSTSLTQEAWFKFAGASGTYNALLGKPYGTGIDDSFTLWIEAGTLRGYVGATTSPQISAPWTSLSEWHHAAFTYDAAASKQTLYIDGAAVACAAASGAIKYDAHSLFVGADADNGTQSGFWNGALDEVRLFSTARTATQIWADLHTHQLGPNADLIAEWTLDEGSGQSAADSSGQALDAVLGSSSAVEASDPAWVEGR